MDNLELIIIHYPFVASNIVEKVWKSFPRELFCISLQA